MFTARQPDQHLPSLQQNRYHETDPEVEEQERDADPSPPASAQVKNGGGFLQTLSRLYDVVLI
jgi:hypothetical protein